MPQHRGVERAVFYYRDRDMREIDLLFDVDGELLPVEIKRSATAKRSWLAGLSVLDRLDRPRGQGAVLCLDPEPVPLDDRTWALPFGAL